MFFVVNIHLLVNELCRLFLGLICVMEKDIPNTFALVTYHHSLQLVPSDNSTLRCNTINVETIKFLNTNIYRATCYNFRYTCIVAHTGIQCQHRTNIFAIVSCFQAVTLAGSSKANIIMSKTQQRYSNEPYLSGV